jgi:PLP dependent protein
MSVADNLSRIKKEIPPHVKLIAVTKTYPLEVILEAYHAGHKVFGENRVQELTPKHQDLPQDIEWHLIGHLQSNKVKYIAPFVRLIHSVDSWKLLQEINKCGEKSHRIIDCLLQVHIAEEETKFGLSFEEAEEILASKELQDMKHARLVGMMGMATLTEDTNQIRKEFRALKSFFEKSKVNNPQLTILSMGMSSDYTIAIEEGSTMIRIGSSIFGSRK